MTAPIRVHRMSSPLGEWELALGEPSPALRPFVQGSYAGSIERNTGMLRRLEIPHPGVVCIFNFGDPYRVSDPRFRADGAWLGSFVAGLYDSFVHVDAAGLSQCVQCNLTPLGALQLLGMPLEPLANRSVPLSLVLGGELDEVVERMHGAPDWETRFALLESFWLRRLVHAATPSSLVSAAWRALTRSHGKMSVAGIADQLGCSRRHLTACFREQTGLPPRTVGRILRFQRVVDRLVGANGDRLSEIAHACGYYDHAHFDRDFRDFTGRSPSAYLATRHPTFGTVLAGD